MVFEIGLFLLPENLTLFGSIFSLILLSAHMVGWRNRSVEVYIMEYLITDS